MNSHRTFDAREQALKILYAVESQGKYASHLLSAMHQQTGVDAHQRALAEKLVKGVLEHKSEIDKKLSTRLSRGLESLPPRVLIILRIGIYQLKFLDRIQKAVAVDSAVELAKRFSSPPLARLVNAVLRGYLREESKTKYVTPKNAKEVSTAFSHPLWIVEQWISQIGLDETIALCQRNNEATPLYLRINTLQTEKEALIKKLASEGVTAEPANYARDALLLEQLPQKLRIHELEAFKEGLFTIQDQASCLTGQIAFEGACANIVDLCAAPGGKATHLAALNKNKGRIIAVDPTEKRLQLVKETAKRLGLTNIEYVCSDGRTFNPETAPELVLVDAPCSGLGVLGRRSDLRWQRDETSLPDLCALQLALLEQAARIVRPGGRVVYSTCTTSTEENEGTVQEFLRQNPGFEVSTITDAHEDLLTPEGFLRTWPQRHNMGGSFTAVLKKK